MIAYALSQDMRTNLQVNALPSGRGASLTIPYSSVCSSSMEVLTRAISSCASTETAARVIGHDMRTVKVRTL